MKLLIINLFIFFLASLNTILASQCDDGYHKILPEHERLGRLSKQVAGMSEHISHIPKAHLIMGVRDDEFYADQRFDEKWVLLNLNHTNPFFQHRVLSVDFGSIPEHRALLPLSGKFDSIVLDYRLGENYCNPHKKPILEVFRALLKPGGQFVFSTRWRFSQWGTEDTSQPLRSQVDLNLVCEAAQREITKRFISTDRIPMLGMCDLNFSRKPYYSILSQASVDYVDEVAKLFSVYKDLQQSEDESEYRKKCLACDFKHVYGNPAGFNHIKTAEDSALMKSASYRIGELRLSDRIFIEAAIPLYKRCFEAIFGEGSMVVSISVPHPLPIKPRPDYIENDETGPQYLFTVTKQSLED